VDAAGAHNVVVIGLGILEVAPGLLTLHTGHVDQQVRRDPSAPPSIRRWGKAMYVAVRRYEGVTDPQRVAQVGEEDFVPIISELPGFVAHYTVDAGDGVMVGISVFEHKDAEEQSTYRAGELVGERLEPLLPNPPQVTAGEVVVYKAK
jgi:hypothetical protein